METSDLVSVYTLTNALDAEIVKGLLQAVGIHCFLDGEESAANLGLAFFQINVMVPAESADRAGKLITSHERVRSGKPVSAR